MSSKHFNPQTDIPDLSGKVILVTGGNSGLGYATIEHFASHNPAKIYLASRSLTKAKDAISKLLAATPNAKIKPLELDLASMASVKAAAERFSASSERLDLLYLNGGIGSPPHNTSSDGYEIQFATNYLGHALLTQYLMPKLLATEALPGADVRIIVMSSVGHKTFGPKHGIHFDLLKTDMKDFSGMALYGQSMLARTHFAYVMAKRYPQLTTVSLHPGTVQSNITEGEKSSFLMKWGFRMLMAVSGVTSSEGAKNQVYLGVANGLKNGAYYEPIGKEVAGKNSYRDGWANELWNWTEHELKRYNESGWQ
jgi:NAD(P)-dependent dehydrogenase (short-subunit alcohol dehydrogenase family)